MKDGKVAVIYSPRFGAGYSTWASFDDKSEVHQMIFDSRLVKAVLDGNEEEFNDIFRALFQTDFYCDFKHLEIAWIPSGELFEITEYDGEETVRLIDYDKMFIRA